MSSAIDRFLKHYEILIALPDLGLLSAIGKAFSFLPYENVTKILKEAGSTGESKFRSAEEVLEDHLRWNTGGTCFSLCNALKAVLERCGFRPFIAMGDMHYGKNIHCAVIVPIGNRSYLMDPGYLLCDPMPLPSENLEVIQETRMNVVTLRQEATATFSLYTRETGQQKWRYHLRAWPVSATEFHQHWLYSFSLNSMENILLSRLDSSSRIYFRKNRIEVVHHQDRSKRMIGQGDATELSTIFGLPADLIAAAHRALIGRPQ